MPPTMGVTMLKTFVVQQTTALGQLGDNRVVGLVDKLARKQLGVVQKNTITPYRIQDIQPVLLPHHKIVGAVTGRGMYRSGAGFGGRCVEDQSGVPSFLL